MWIFYENPELKFDDVKTPFSLPKMRRKAIFAAVGTTSGTGTEVTSFSVITEDDTKIKYPIADFEITPDIAIVDTEIPLSMLETLTADSGMMH
jgi:alcohol dehydrogenase class IV